MRGTCAVAAVALALPGLGRAQQQPPTFGVGIDVINLNVSVTDGVSRYVTDLGEGDFAIYEDGVRQQISLFVHQDLPISLALLVDGSASMDEKLGQARSAAIRFVATLKPQDTAQVAEESNIESPAAGWRSPSVAIRSEASSPERSSWSMRRPKRSSSSTRTGRRRDRPNPGPRGPGSRPGPPRPRVGSCSTATSWTSAGSSRTPGSSRRPARTRPPSRPT